MAEQTTRKAWVDRYVRDEMMVDEIAEYETALMESPGMQRELETVLGLREAFFLQSQQNPATGNRLAEPVYGARGWQPLSLTATVILALFSTAMFWKISNDVDNLQRQLDLLNQPRSQVLTVPVNIMRSAHGQVPDVIVQKPAGHAAILLDIELGPLARKLELLEFALVDEAGNPILAWTAAPAPDGRAAVMLNNEQVPASSLWLQISSSDGQVLARSLLEFRL